MPTKTKQSFRYHYVVETKDDLIHLFDSNNEPPRVGEWLDLEKFNIVGYFEIQRVVHVWHASPEPTWVFLRVKKNLSKFKRGSRYPNLKLDDI